MTLVFGGIGLFRIVPNPVVIDIQPVTDRRNEIKLAFEHVQDPYPRLGDKNFAASTGTLSYADIRKIVHLYSSFHPDLQPNTTDAMVWAQKNSLITSQLFDKFMFIWMRPC